MDDETRAVAKQKADAMNERIGYPELLTDEEELTKEYVMVRRHYRTPSGNLSQRLTGAV
jgi:membrane metallo-endopeptidase-like protein 1